MRYRNLVGPGDLRPSSLAGGRKAAAKGKPQRLPCGTAKVGSHRALVWLVLLHFGVRQDVDQILEFRAATSLGRLWGGQGRLEEAYQALAEVYNWFTEGVEFADSKEAHVLLEQLEETIGKKN